MKFLTSVILFLSFSIYCSNLYAQNESKDKQQLVVSLLKLSAENRDDSLLCLSYAQQALDVAKSESNKKLIFESYYHIGGIYKQVKKNQQAINAFENAQLLAENLENKEAVFNTCLILGDCYRFKDDTAKAISYYKKGFDMAIKSFDTKRQIEILFPVARMYDSVQNYTNSIQTYHKIIQIAAKENDVSNLLQAYNRLGIRYYYIGNFDKAIIYYQKALDLGTQVKDSSSISSALNNIGTIYGELNKDSLALLHYQRALDIALSKNDKYGISTGFNNVADCYLQLNRPDSAEIYLKKALQICLEQNDYDGLYFVYFGLGEVKEQQKEYQNAILFYKKSLVAQGKVQDKTFISQSLMAISKLYLLLNQNKNAWDYLKKAEVYVNQIESLVLKKGFCETCSKYYKATKNFEKALEYKELYNQYNDSIFNNTLTHEISGFKMKYEEQKQQHQIDSLEQSIKNHRIESQKNAIARNFLLVLVLFILVLVGVIYYAYRHKIKTNKQLEQTNTNLDTLNHHLISSEENLKQLNSTKDRFFSIIAHDLRSPFTALLGLSEFILSNYEDLSREETREYTKLINDSARNLYNLLENLLNWARSQTNSIKYRPRTEDLNIIVCEVFDLLNVFAKNKKINLIAEIPKQTFAFFDSEMISTVLRNLIYNSIKFTKVNGEIRITVYNVDNQIAVSVCDNGIGISEKNIEKLFKLEKPYTTLGTAKEQGTGLGLFLCKEFVEKNKGVIWVESEIGKGSDFIFTLPITEE